MEKKLKSALPSNTTFLPQCRMTKPTNRKALTFQAYRKSFRHCYCKSSNCSFQHLGSNSSCQNIHKRFQSIVNSLIITGNVNTNISISKPVRTVQQLIISSIQIIKICFRLTSGFLSLSESESECQKHMYLHL